MGKNSQRNSKPYSKLKVAIVVDFLMYLGGAEQVLKKICELFPNASLYTLFYNKKFTSEYFHKIKIKASWIQHFKFFYRALIILFPSAIENFNLDDYDLVISSGIWSKGIITKPKTLHIAYCHSPNRFLWEDSKNYIYKNTFFGFRSLTKILFHILRIWDFEASQRPNIIISNSLYTQNRIKKYYKRESKVIYPGIQITTRQITDKIQTNRKKYFLIVSRLQYYKNIELAIKTFNKLGLPLIIVGKGVNKKRLRKLAKNNIKFLGFVSEQELIILYKNAIALILPCIEDFGLTPIEAMSLGTPALCFKGGGAIEYIKPGLNGELFEDNNLEQEVKKILNAKYNKKDIIKSIQKFNQENFKKQLKILIDLNYMI